MVIKIKNKWTIWKFFQNCQKSYKKRSKVKSLAALMFECKIRAQISQILSQECYPLVNHASQQQAKKVKQMSMVKIIAFDTINCVLPKNLLNG